MMDTSGECGLKITLFSCGLCRSHYRDRKARNKHRNKIHGFSKHVCDACGAPFKTKNGLAIHGDHDLCDATAGQRKRKIDIYRCPQCPRVCFSMRGYSNHMTSIHGGDATREPLVCMTCDREFKTAYNLKRHAAKAHNPLDFSCGGCKKSFTTALSVKRHHARYHGHIRCKFCTRKFTRQASMQMHVRKTHRRDTAVVAVPSTSRAAADDYPYGCPKCGKSFNRKYNLSMHARGCGTTNGGGLAAKMVGGGGVTHSESESWRVTKLNTGENEFFKMSRWHYEFTMKEDLLHPPPKTWREMIRASGVYFDELVRVITENVPDADYLGVVITHSSLDFPINCGVRERARFSSRALLEEIARVVQSFRAFRLADPFTVSVKQVGVESGGNDGVGWEAYPTRDIAIDRKRTVIKIRNTDNLCLARAVAVGIVYCEFKQGAASKEDWENCKGGGRLQWTIAEFLMAAAALPCGKRCSVVDTQEIARILPMGGGPEKLFEPANYTINVYGTDGDFDLVFQAGAGKSVINVIHRNGHFDAVLSIAALKGVKKYCDYCHTVIMRDRPHKCHWVCSACDSFVDDVHGRTPDEVTDKRCRRCLKIFYNAVCKQRHRDKCVRVCRECRKPDVSGHKCGDAKIYCPRCSVSYARRTAHTCYMRPDSARRRRGEGRGMVFFDMESCFKPLIRRLGDEGTYECEHLPIFIGARKICGACTKRAEVVADLPQGCDDCADVTFSGVDAVERFVLWLFEPGQRDSVVISHSGGRYDCVLLLKSLYRHHRKIRFTPKGAGFISIDLPSSRIRFLDSYLFIGYRLEAFPKIFGFPEGEAKGFFPYRFLEPGTLHYVGDVPDKEFFPTNKYDARTMEDFDRWHAGFAPGAYDIQEEIRKYCVQDVNLLCRGWTQFREMFIRLCETDPNDRLTISSTCNAFFRNVCMKPDTMALLPNNERLVPNDVQSDIATRYLLWLEGELGVRFWMSGRGRGEKKVGRYKLDAYDPKTRRGWDVLGCYFHGCPTCYKRTTIVAGGLKAEAVYLESRYRKSKISRRLDDYVEIWEHEIRAKMRTDASMRAKMEAMDIVSPINVREALFGGRVEVFRLYYDAGAENRGLSYADINSLYPTVMRSSPYPTGKPALHNNARKLKRFLRRVNNGDIPWKGLIKCRVLAEDGGLHVPVLPRRDEESDKCMFTLCRTCPSEPPEDGICRHTDEERCFVGVWTHCELELAIAKGYRVLAIYEVWSWPSEAWRDDLFKDYIDKFIALKVQASGWPREQMTDDEREDYLEEYLVHEGIVLDKDKMEFNAALRVFCKICVNCLWGYLCQRGNKYQQCFHCSRSSFLKHLVDDKISISDIQETGEPNKILTVFKDLEDHVQNNQNVNAVYGVFTTSYARLFLYKHMERLGKRMVYCDTDSLVYMPPDDDNAYEPPMHPHYLGKFKDELPPGEEICQWVATAPKSYAYRLKKSGQTKVVMKGITVDARTKELLGFDELEKLLRGGIGATAEGDGGEGGGKITIPVADFFVRDSTRGRIYTRKLEKTVNFNYDKRHVVADDFTTTPFGYRKGDDAADRDRVL